MVLYSKFTYGSQFLGEKNALEIRFPVAEKLSKYKRSIFFETPCSYFKSDSNFVKRKVSLLNKYNKNRHLLNH